MKRKKAFDFYVTSLNANVWNEYNMESGQKDTGQVLSSTQEVEWK